MSKLLDTLMPKVWPWLALAVAAVLVVQTLRIKDLQLEIAGLQTSQSKTALAQAEQGLVAIETKASGLLAHAGQQQDNIYEYTQKITKLEAARVRDAADIASLQQQLRTTATARAQAAGDAAAARDLADQHQQLATSLAEGAGVVGELVGLVEQRDAEVTLLQKQVLTERQVVDKLMQK